MSTRETRLDRGRRRGRGISRRVVTELLAARLSVGVSQRALAQQMGWWQSELSRLENLVGLDDLSIVRASELASLLGLELAVSLHPAGEPIRDPGHKALIDRFVALLAPIWKVAFEVPLPGIGDPRWWDLVIRLVAPDLRQVAGVEAETRIRDQQALVRRMHGRLIDGGTDVVILLLSDSATNRRLVGDLRAALGAEFATPPRAMLSALREGRQMPGSGVILL